MVNPRDIDRGSGAIVSAGAGRGEVGFALNRGLELGDILVPRTSSQPCVLLTEEHRALFFTQQFIALRTDGQIASPCLIWALLSSTNGQTARAVLGSGTTVPRIEANALLDLQIGITSGEQTIKLRDFLPTPAVWLSAVPSWRSSWAHAVLRSGVAWQLSALGDEDEHETVVLGDVATISRPRKLCLVEDVSRAAIFPVLNRRCFAGGPALKPLDWQPAEGTLTKGDASIIVRSTGVPRAGIAQSGCLLDDGLILVELRETGGLAPLDAARRIVAHLNSPIGQHDLEAASTGVTSKRLRPESLGEVRIPAWSTMRDPGLDLPSTTSRLDEFLFGVEE